MIGTIFFNRYRIDAELGRGGMGVIYRAHDQVLDRDVALKLLTDPALGPEGRSRLLREARAAARLNHPNIVSVYDAGEADGPEGATPFIVMEYVEGQSLYHRWPLPLPEILAVTQQVCAALDHAHTHGIIHRDLKLENILLTAGGQAKLTDFGLARTAASRVTQEGTIVGTVFYLAPEMVLAQQVDGRADLYALGVMLYELTTGKLPFNAEDPLAVISQHLYAPVVPPRTHQPDLPAALERLILRLLEKRPEDRPASADDVRRAAEDLERLVQAGLPPAAWPAAEAPSPLERLVRGRLVGREAEKAEVAAAWRQAAAGESQVLLLSGEPGIGKTRLVRELIALAEFSGGAAYLAECYAEGGAPYAPVGQIIQAALPAEGADGLGTQLSPIVLADLLTFAPALRARFPGVLPNPPLEPQAEQQRLFESALDLCQRRAQRRPLLIVLDDAHWADGGTLFLVRYLARRLRALRLPVLLVLTYRETELDQARALNDVVSDLLRERLAARLKLTRLTRAQTGELLTVMFETEISVELVDGLYRETEGNPFFIEEVCKALVEQGLIYRAGAGWQRRAMDEMQIPQSVRLAIQSRVSQLDEQAQTTLRLAAVIGREFDFALLHQAGELDEEALVEALEVAERAQLITEVRHRHQPGREAFSFVHALIPAALRESLSGLRRHRMHKRVAATLERLRPDDFEALAYHYGQAGDEAQARLYYRKAGDRSRAVYANEDAIRFYTEALTLIPAGEPDHFDLLAARVKVYDLVGRREAQLADAQALLALAETLDDDARRFDAMMALVDYEFATGLVQGRELADRAVALANRLGDPVREAWALLRVGWVARVHGDLRNAQASLLAAAERFRHAGRLGEAAESLHTLSLALSDLNQPVEAKRQVEEALNLSRQAGDKRQEANSLRRLAILLNDDRQFAAAAPIAEAALALHRQLGDRESECHALNVLGQIRASQGDLAEGEALTRQSFEVAAAIDSGVGMSNALSGLGRRFQASRDYEGYIRLLEAQMARDVVRRNRTVAIAVHMILAGVLADVGRLEAALALGEAVLPEVAALLGAGNLAIAQAEMARCLAELGRFPDAWRYLDAALAAARQHNLPYVISRVQYEHAYACLLASEAAGGDAGRLAEAEAAILEAIALGQGLKFEQAMPFACDYAAEVYLALGQTEQALAYTTEALALTERHKLEQALPERFWYTHARALRAAGRPAEADVFLARAGALVLEIAERMTDPVLRAAWLTGGRTNRRLLADWRPAAAHPAANLTPG